MDSWFADWWLDMAYLEYRERLPVWSSPGKNVTSGLDQSILKMVLTVFRF
jgi:hypothetical protein